MQNTLVRNQNTKYEILFKFGDFKTQNTRIFKIHFKYKIHFEILNLLCQFAQGQGSPNSEGPAFQLLGLSPGMGTSLLISETQSQLPGRKLEKKFY